MSLQKEMLTRGMYTRFFANLYDNIHQIDIFQPKRVTIKFIRLKMKLQYIFIEADTKRLLTEEVSLIHHRDGVISGPATNLD